jgi:hypothetical protein
MSRSVPIVLLALAMLAGPARAADPKASLEDQLQGMAERLPLQGRKGPSLFQPGFGVGEYSGWSKSIGRKTSVPGVFSGDKAAASLQIVRPGMEPVTGDCRGGQSRLGLGWITFKREGLAYVCGFGGSAPTGAELALAQSKGSLLGQMMQPQRAAELSWGGITLRAETRYISGLPMSSGGASSYVIFRPDGTPIGGLQTNGLRPTVWLPKAQGAERDAAAVLALALFSFQDPGRPGG